MEAKKETQPICSWKYSIIPSKYSIERRVTTQQSDIGK